MVPDEKVRRAHAALAHALMAEQTQHNSTYTHPIDTTVPTSAAPDRTTPRAQTREDHQNESRRQSRASVNLTGKCA
jgi:hypothetical protein